MTPILNAIQPTHSLYHTDVRSLHEVGYIRGHRSLFYKVFFVYYLRCYRPDTKTLTLLTHARIKNDSIKDRLSALMAEGPLMNGLRTALDPGRKQRR